MTDERDDARESGAAETLAGLSQAIRRELELTQAELVTSGRKALAAGKTLAAAMVVALAIAGAFSAFLILVGAISLSAWLVSLLVAIFWAAIAAALAWEARRELRPRRRITPEGVKTMLRPYLEEAKRQRAVPPQAAAASVSMMRGSESQQKEEGIPAQSSGEPGPDSPTELKPSDWKATLKRTLEEIKEDRVMMTAGSLAYSWFLALFPAIVALIGLIALLRLSPSVVNSLTAGISHALPPGAAGVITRAIENASAEGSGASLTAVVGLVIALWSASGGMASLQTGLNIAYDVPEDRKFIPKRLLALLLTVVMFVLGGIAAAFLVFRLPLGSVVHGVVPLSSTVFGPLWFVVSLLLGIVAMSILFSALYFLAPKRDNPRWQWVSPGGIVATVIWVLASLAFSFYVGHFGSYGKTYGPFAGVVILVLWLYLTGLAILVGAELNAELERQAALRARQ
jgi:membrane protein